MRVYAKAAIAGFIAGLLTSIVVPLVSAIVMFGMAVTGGGGVAGAEIALWPFGPLFFAGFLAAFVWTIVREKRRAARLTSGS